MASKLLTSALFLSSVAFGLAASLPKSLSQDLRAKRMPRSVNSTSRFLTEAAQKYVVNGTGLPEVEFDVGESYAGLMPISNETDAQELFFWFFPSPEEYTNNDITIWLQGGPGCSPFIGLLEENGPFLWQPGTFKPIRNPWSWTNLTNMVWVEQPVRTGFSQGEVTATSEVDVAAQFLGFFKNFVDTFAMQGFNVHVTGESFAGYHIPNLAQAMLNTTDTEYYNVRSIMMYDPYITYAPLQQAIPVASFAEKWKDLLNLNRTFMDHLHHMSDECGYTSFMEESYQFPPAGLLPTPPYSDGTNATCDLFSEVNDAATLANPCFDIYNIAHVCPLPWDVLGIPGSYDYVPPGAFVYFNRTDVQEAINAPIGNWRVCAGSSVFVNGTDNTNPPALTDVLPDVIEKLDRVVIGHGLLDFEFVMNGTIIALQNMTWGGEQGFTHAPETWEDHYVPHLDNWNLGAMAGSGIMGDFNTERGLTMVRIAQSGHMVPQFAPSAAYRQVEFMLGRIETLGDVSPFPTQPQISH